MITAASSFDDAIFAGLNTFQDRIRRKEHGERKEIQLSKAHVHPRCSLMCHADETTCF